MKDILALYSPYHEMDIRQFVDKMNALYKTARPETNLKRLRHRTGLSQRELAELSGVPVRTIQQYEQRQKNINKAQAEYLVMLPKVLETIFSVFFSFTWIHFLPCIHVNVNPYSIS